MLPIKDQCMYFSHYTSQKYNLATSCPQSWRDLSCPSQRILLQEITHKTETRDCCLSTAAQDTQLHSEQLPGEGALHRTEAF